MRAGSQETMTAGLIAGLEPRETHGNDLVAQQSDDPTDRTGEVLARRAPSAGLRPGNALDDSLKRFGKQFGNVCGRRVLDGVDVFGAVFVAALEVSNVDALAARKAGRRLGRIALGVERDAGSWAAEFLHGSLGALRDSLDDRHEATRARIHLYVVEGNAHGAECVCDERRKLLGCGVQVEGGQLFGADFECESGLRHPMPPSRRRRRLRHASYRTRSTPSQSCVRARYSPCARLRK